MFIGICIVSLCFAVEHYIYIKYGSGPAPVQETWMKPMMTALAWSTRATRVERCSFMPFFARNDHKEKWDFETNKCRSWTSSSQKRWSVLGFPSTTKSRKMNWRRQELAASYDVFIAVNSARQLSIVLSHVESYSSQCSFKWLQCKDLG